MPEIIISKIKPRRGTDAQLKTTSLDQGEIVSTTDTKRVYVGTGSGYGGFVVGSRINTPLVNYYSLSTLVAEIGDIAPANNLFYQLTAADYTNIASWANIGAKLDTTFFQYTASNSITLTPSSISAIYINPTTVLSGIKIEDGILQTNIDTTSLQISANKLGLKASGITEREISSGSFGNGVTGGSGTTISLDVDTTSFYFDSGTLKLSSLPPSWFGEGLVYNSPTLSAVLTDVDETTITKNDAGVISSATIGASAFNQLASVRTDEYGRVINNQTSIFDILTGNSALGSYNNTNTLSCIFNGYAAQALSGSIPGLELANFTALSSNGAIITLTSAGFILFNLPSQAQSGAGLGRFAIPIFSY